MAIYNNRPFAYLKTLMTYLLLFITTDIIVSKVKLWEAKLCRVS